MGAHCYIEVLGGGKEWERERERERKKGNWERGNQKQTTTVLYRIDMSALGWMNGKPNISILRPSRPVSECLKNKLRMHPLCTILFTYLFLPKTGKYHGVKFLNRSDIGGTYFFFTPLPTPFSYSALLEFASLPANILQYSYNIQPLLYMYSWKQVIGPCSLQVLVYTVTEVYEIAFRTGLMYSQVAHSFDIFQLWKFSFR